MKESIVIVDHISHKYSDTYVLQDINFEIPSNCIMGLLGSNGAGKSTTMNIICGVLKQTAGNVYIDGKNVLKNPILAKRLIGFLPQKAPLYMDMTVNEYLTYCAELRLVEKKEIPKAIERVESICSIGHYRHKVIKQLSGGYQQRVGIAQAIIHNPRFVVLDEPTNGLDPNQILDVRKLIKSLAEEATVLVSTHILSEVEAICSDIVMIEHGHLVFSGTMRQFNDSVARDSVWVRFAHEVDIRELSAFPGCQRVQILGNGEYRIHFDVRLLSEVTEDLIVFCQSKEWHLQEIISEKCSLNDVFAYLSSQKTKA